MLSGFLPTRGKTLSVCLSQLSGWLLKDEVSTDFYQLLWGHLSPNLLLLQEKKKTTSASYRYAHYNPNSCDFFSQMAISSKYQEFPG